MADRQCDWIPPRSGPQPDETTVGWLVRYRRDHLPVSRSERSRATVAPLLGLTVTKLTRTEEGDRPLTLAEASRVVEVLGLKWKSLRLAAMDDAHREDATTGTDQRLATFRMQNARPDPWSFADTRYEDGDGLAGARRVLGYSEKQLADALGVDLPLYQAWEAGLTPPDEIVQESLDLMVEATKAIEETDGEVALQRGGSRAFFPDLSRVIEEPAPSTPSERLSHREVRIAEMLAAGLSNAEIAEILNVTVATVKYHVSRVLLKLRATSRVQAAAAYLADENGQRFGLTLRETEVSRMIADGMTNAEIAKQLFLETTTVKHHVANILRKLGAAHRAQIAEAFRTNEPQGIPTEDASGTGNRQ
jgi:DNA-binding NarL/FixJ family response regulator